MLFIARRPRMNCGLEADSAQVELATPCCRDCSRRAIAGH